MIRNRKLSLLAAVLGGVFAVAMTASASGTSFTVSPLGQMTSTVSGSQTEGFGSGLPAGVTDNCTSSTDCGILPGGTYTSVAHNPAGDSNPYIATGINGESVTINFAAAAAGLGISGPINYFGLYWGSVDTYNQIQFFDGATLVATFTGSQILAANSSIVAGTSAAFVNFFANGDTWTSAVLTSGNTENFESDNFAFADVKGSQTPEPASLFLLGTGLIGLGAAVRRRLA